MTIKVSFSKAISIWFQSVNNIFPYSLELAGGDGEKKDAGGGGDDEEDPEVKSKKKKENST